jgi:hypothetical protein
MGCSFQPLSQKANVKAQMSSNGIFFLFALCKQIKEERAMPSITQDPRDKLIAWTVPATPTSVRKQHQSSRALGNLQMTPENNTTNGNCDGFAHRRAYPLPCARALLSGTTHLINYLPSDESRFPPLAEG